MNPYRAFSKEHMYAYSIRVFEVDERQEALCIHFWVRSIDGLCLGCVARRASTKGLPWGMMYLGVKC